MKKSISLGLALIMLLGCLGLAACGGGNSSGTTPTSTSTGGGTTSTPAGGSTWDSIPIYAGAKQAQKGSWAIPPEEGEWAEVEWRYYETDASTDDVAAFYKSQMPANGWEEMAWMEAQGIAWAYYSKNDEKDGAMFWCSADEDTGKTVFALMRAKK